MTARRKLITCLGASLLAMGLAWPGAAMASLDVDNVELRVVGSGDPFVPYTVGIDALPGDEVEIRITIDLNEDPDGANTWCYTKFFLGEVSYNTGLGCLENGTDWDVNYDVMGVETFTIFIPDTLPGSEDPVCEFLWLAFRAFRCGDPCEHGGDCNEPGVCYAEFFLPESIRILPQQPDVECVAPWTLDGCLNNGNSCRTFYYNDVFVSGDPNCGEGHWLGLARRDAAGEWTAYADSVTFCCNDIGPQEILLSYGDSNDPENFALCTTWVEIKDCGAPYINYGCPCDRDLCVDDNCVATLPDYRYYGTCQYGYTFWHYYNLWDNCDAFGDLTVTQYPEPGTKYGEDGWPEDCPTGGVYVTLTVSDTSPDSHDSSCTFWVSFVDCHAPTITCPPDVDEGQDPGICGRQLTFPRPEVHDNCCPDEDLRVTAQANYDHILIEEQPDGTWIGNFPLGLSEVTWTVYDCCYRGYSRQCTQRIRVRDTVDPWIVCPPDRGYFEDEIYTSQSGSNPPHSDGGDECGAWVCLDAPEFGDNCGILDVYNDYEGWDYVMGDEPGGSHVCEGQFKVWFPVGETEVTWTIVDTEGRESTCSHFVLVIDDEDPFLWLCYCWLDFVQTGPGSCSELSPENLVEQLVLWNFNQCGYPYAAEDNCGVEIYVIESVGNTYDTTEPVTDQDGNYIRRTDPFSLGEHLIWVIAEDPSGNQSAPCVLDIFVLVGGGCPEGACCASDGGCTVGTAGDCADAGGTYQGDGTNCDDTDCSQPPTGACCVDETCTVETADDCTNAGGAYQGDGTGCDPNPCDLPDPTGACCDGDTCTVETEADCGGDYQGDGTDCDPDPCAAPPTGACCVGDTCTVETEADCGGDYQGDGTDCDPNPCAGPPTGACCVGDTCTVETEADCGGDYQGDGTDCDPNPCAPPDPEGACCFPSGTCVVSTEDDCDNAGADSWTEGEDCDPNECPQPPTGACCVPNGNCAQVTESVCSFTYDGDYQGSGTNCVDTDCPQPIGVIDPPLIPQGTIFPPKTVDEEPVVTAEEDFEADTVAPAFGLCGGAFGFAAPSMLLGIAGMKLGYRRRRRR